MSDASPISRRELFSRMFERAQNCLSSAGPTTKTKQREVQAPRVAIVQGRFCLAYQRSFCSACVERCPVPGAVVVEEHVPRIVVDVCTGCGICHQVCPAPRNAILMAPRQRISASQK